jgi:hypothetical protein
VTGNKQTIKGDHNVQQDGVVNYNNSPVTNVYESTRLTPSDATKLLKLTEKLKQGHAKRTAAPLADFQTKLDYNKVIRYKAMYMGAPNSEQMAVIEEAIQSMLDSQPLIMRLVELFAQVTFVEDGKIAPGNGDAQLQSIEDEITQAILNDPEFPGLDISIEIVRMFVRGLVSYGVMICKILLNPNEEGV